MIAVQTFDARLTPARPDAAASHLRGVIDVPRYLDPQACLVAVPVAPLRPRPQGEAAPDSELLMGEGFVVYDREDGWAWGQSELDGYVGYIADAHVVPA
ncbi:MAG: peptidase P60, partial [Pseudomonadota bacterium]